MSLLRWGTVGVLGLGMLLAAACGSDKKDPAEDDDEAPVGPATGSSCDPTLTYDKDIQPLMTQYCTRCHAKSVTGDARHGAPGDHNFETEMGLANEAIHADQDSGSGPKITNTKMPPVDRYPELNLPVPTMAERVTLSRWLACQI
ncbi:MAG: uncharacterized protein JWN04_4758 [Myxococcaceae bacterium]|nr:uncharacterized protein [Myxococcaceae bacterium]